ncbi:MULTISPECIES: hypothetical protein [unclassified Streptomyces]|uniref:hypothetical protein n=1 Tax=unclassified Streptomyces TaxID=2593676 RepID=UPI001660F2C0|nr:MULTISPECIES: hypothetical protein [unclassified Streptomyces]MBD0707149.1 hypothetical protein [Streptomyces sp. CBMA291]MBD0713637.1 hypothetical protein [Streptomyces sp. CBMA370]
MPVRPRLARLPRPPRSLRPSRLPRPFRSLRPLPAALGLTVLAAGLLTAGPARAGDSVARDIATAYTATARYAYEPEAVAAGFVRTDTCVAMPGMGGGMGYHYLNRANVGSTDPARPATVIYATGADGRRHLVAVEWIVRDSGQPAPDMFGRPFDGPFDHAVLGRIYDRHVWLYKENPDGLFARYNPTVTCP